MKSVRALGLGVGFAVIGAAAGCGGSSVQSSGAAAGAEPLGAGASALPNGGAVGAAAGGATSGAGATVNSDPAAGAGAGPEGGAATVQAGAASEDGGDAATGGAAGDACTAYLPQLVKPSFTVNLAERCSLAESVSTGMSYSGPAVVGTSTTTELTVLFEQPSCADAAGTNGAAGAAGSAGAAADSGVRPSTITGEALPVFPARARIWLSYFIRDAYKYTLASGSYAQAVTVRSQQDGTILFAGSYNGDPPDGPAVKVGQQRLLCKTERPDSAFPTCPTLTVSYFSLEVAADTPVTFADGERKTIQLGGIDYDTRVRDTSVSSSPQCQGIDRHAELDGGRAVTLYAKNVQVLIAALPLAPPTP